MTCAFDLGALESLDRSATPGPWFVRFLEDDHAMSALGISVEPDTGANEEMAVLDYPGPDIVAATLIQAPPYVVSSDRRWQENADLIVAMRNALPELMRLARLGQAMEQA